MKTTLSSKGQIVIPRQIRLNHGWKPGVSFSIIEEVIGCAGYSGPAVSLADI